MKNKIIYILLFNWTIIYPNIIEKIIVSGNHKTSEKIILNQINHPLNIEFQSDLINEDIENLLNMNVFESVDITFNNNTYHIKVVEKKLITFAPLIRKKEGIGWSVGPIININNINGKAKNIKFSSSLGAIKSGQIQYFNQKLLLEYIYNTYNSIEKDYAINEKKLFISYIINKKKYSVHLTPQINFYQLKYTKENQINQYKYFSFAYNFNYKISHSSQYKIHYTYNLSLNNYDDYARLLLNYEYSEKIMEKLWLRFSSKTILNSKINSPDYENIYIGGEDFIRGFNPNPIDNPIQIQNNLVYKNLILYSLQFEIPIRVFPINLLKKRLLLFYDYGQGSNKYNNFKNKLEGFGFGISLITTNKMKFDICIGYNNYGSRTFHFISNN